MNLSITDLQNFTVNPLFLPLIRKISQIPLKSSKITVSTEGTERVTRDYPVIFLLPSENYEHAFQFSAIFSTFKNQRDSVISLCDSALVSSLSKIIKVVPAAIPFPSQSFVLAEDFKSQFKRYPTGKEFDIIYNYIKTNPEYKSESFTTVLKYLDTRGKSEFSNYINLLYAPWRKETERIFQNTVIYQNLNIITFSNRSSLYPQSPLDQNLIYYISKQLGSPIYPVDVYTNFKDNKNSVRFVIQPAVELDDYPSL